MSVMACDRNQCENVLCDHYSSEYGYICNECLNELKGDVRFMYDTLEFMRSPKDKHNDTLYHERHVDTVFTPIN